MQLLPLLHNTLCVCHSSVGHRAQLGCGNSSCGHTACVQKQLANTDWPVCHAECPDNTSKECSDGSEQGQGGGRCMGHENKGHATRHYRHSQVVIEDLCHTHTHTHTHTHPHIRFAGGGNGSWQASELLDLRAPHTRKHIPC